MGYLIGELDDVVVDIALSNSIDVVKEDFEVYHRDLLMNTVNEFLWKFSIHLSDYVYDIEHEDFGSIVIGETLEDITPEEDFEYDFMSYRKMIRDEFEKVPEGTLGLTGEWTDRFVYDYFRGRDFEYYELSGEIVRCVNSVFKSFQRHYFEKLKDRGYLLNTVSDLEVRFDGLGNVVGR